MEWPKIFRSIRFNHSGVVGGDGCGDLGGDGGGGVADLWCIGDGDRLVLGDADLRLITGGSQYFDFGLGVKWYILLEWPSQQLKKPHSPASQHSEFDLTCGIFELYSYNVCSSVIRNIEDYLFK